MKLSELDKEQGAVLAAIVTYGVSHNEPRKVIESAVATAIVEQGLRNRPSGDGTSVGWRQETASSYGAAVGPRLDLSKTVPAYYQEARTVLAKSPQLGPGELAQAVQRSAYPKRYSEHLAEADNLLRELHFTKGETLLGPLLGKEEGGGLTGPLAGAISWTEGAGKVLANLLSGDFWLRVGKIVAGGVILTIGVKELSKPGATATAVRSVPAKAAKAAEVAA